MAMGTAVFLEVPSFSLVVQFKSNKKNHKKKSRDPEVVHYHVSTCESDSSAKQVAYLHSFHYYRTCHIFL